MLELREAVKSSKGKSELKVELSNLPGQLSLLDAEVTEANQNRPKVVEIWTTSEIVDRLGISRNQLERLKAQGKLPHAVKGYSILKWSGKQGKSPGSHLWEIQET